MQGPVSCLLFALCMLTKLALGNSNPILPGWNPDPTILRVGDDYFISTSTFEYFPGHPIYHSKNLVDWTLVGHALNRPSQLHLYGTPSDAGLWAPGLRHHAGVFYLTSTARYVYSSELRLFPRSFYVTTRDIFSNNWSDPVYFDALGYDADLFWDVNGDVYNTWSGINNAVDKIYGIWQNKIDLSTGNSLTEAKLIFNGTLPDDSAARPEGPHIYHIDGTYYLLIAEGGTDVHHRATIQRGPSPSGPWESNPNNPILFNGADLNNSVQNTGHADIVEGADGRWWGVALGVRPQNGNMSHIQLGRETFLFPVTWEDGWPVFNNGKPITEELDVPGTPQTDRPKVGFVHNFSSTHSRSLDPTFYFLRTPYKPFHSLSARPGFLRLFANSYAPGDRDSPAMILRKQSSYSEEFEVQIDFTPGTALNEAGVTVFYGDLLHSEIGLVGGGGATTSGRRIIVRTAIQAEQVGPWALTTTNATIVTTEYLPLQTKDAPVKLKVLTSPTSYTLGYSESSNASSSFSFVKTFDASTLSIPTAGGFFFKGTSLGIYNTGNGKPSLAPADFSYWYQTPMVN
ncbi:glycosyl hydrolase 43 family protein [Pleurotus pulmonarius]